jgi:hypothetical protein
MSERATDEILHRAFARLEETVLPHARLAGIDAARATVRRRRRTRVALLSAAVAILVLGPPVTLALVRGGRGSPPPVGASNSPTPSTVTTPTGPTLRIRGDSPKVTELDDARLDLPDFNQSFCPSGPTQLRDGRWTGEILFETFRPTVMIEALAAGDVNGDGNRDVVALLTCNAGTDPGGVAHQVAAFTPTGSGYRTIGRVAGVSGGTANLRQPEVLGDGRVRILHVATPNVAPPESLQWRSYRWDGQRFVAAGSEATTSWDASQTRLTVAGTVALAADPTSGPTGTLRITVTNTGGATSTGIMIDISSAVPLTIGLPGVARPFRREGTDQYFWRIVADPVPVGRLSGTLTVHVDSATAVADGAELTIRVSGLAVGDLVQNSATPAQVTIPITVS